MTQSGSYRIEPANKLLVLPHVPPEAQAFKHLDRQHARIVRLKTQQSALEDSVKNLWSYAGVVASGRCVLYLGAASAAPAIPKRTAGKVHSGQASD